MTSTSEDFLMGALIGGAIAAAAALMLTPLSGQNLRQKIAKGLNYLPNGSFKPRTGLSSAARRVGGSIHKPKNPPQRTTRRPHSSTKGRHKPHHYGE